MKGKFSNWWASLSKAAKIGICTGGVVVISSAVVFPTLAFTVWNKELTPDYVIELEYDDCSYALPEYTKLDLKKDKVYLFKVDLSDFPSDIIEACSKQPYRIVVRNDDEEFIDKIISNFSIKYNGTKLTKYKKNVTETTCTEIPAKQYAYCTIDDEEYSYHGAVYAGGANTFPASGEWGKIEFKFKCIKDLPGCEGNDISIRFDY